MEELNGDGAPDEYEDNRSLVTPRVDHLRKLLGKHALLLSWPFGKKGSKKRWSHLTLAAMQNADYLQKLETGNIGAALGEKSGGLCTVDWDDDQWMLRFLAVNPRLESTLRTRGARGCNFWVRCVDEFPASCKLKSGGQEIGEWRANGNQTIISGRHPSGCSYSFIREAPPLAIPFEEIIWPEGVTIPRFKARAVIVHSNSWNTGTQDTQPTQETQVVSSSVPLFSIDQFIPTQRNQSDGLLWAMARHVRTWERDNGRLLSRAEQEILFGEWWKRSSECVDPTKDFYAYLAKWVGDCKTAKVPDDECPLSAAWRSATTEPLPSAALESYGPFPMLPEMKLLVALCFHLQILNGKNPFYLGSRDAAKLLCKPHSTVALWLQALADDEGAFKILKKVSTGSLFTRRTNEYFFVSLIRP